MARPSAQQFAMLSRSRDDSLVRGVDEMTNISGRDNGAAYYSSAGLVEGALLALEATLMSADSGPQRAGSISS
jgi:hypothetical protein